MTGRHRRARNSYEYRASHNAQLRVVSPMRFPQEGRRGPRLDAVVVPTARSLRFDLPGLRLAHDLAASRRCPLIVMCSREARSQDYPADLLSGARPGPRPKPLVLLDVPNGRHEVLPDFLTTRHPTARCRSNDVATKRNLALQIGAVAGWRNVLFLDDDVSFDPTAPRSLDLSSLGDALAVLSPGGMRAVGWPSRGFDDNSVVGHARRLAGRSQDVFISGAALLVATSRDVPFFPDIYNEDWLFLIGLAISSRTVGDVLGWAGTVNQLDYDPFVAKRARGEEVGDVLGEGLMNLLEDDGPGMWSTARDEGHWKSVLMARARLLEGLSRALDPRSLEPSVPKARLALEAALELHAEIDPSGLAHFVHCWRHDLDVWHAVLRDLTARRPRDLHHPLSRLAEALDRTGLCPTVSVHL